MKFNCWDVKQCGRHPGGEKSRELGVCPATTMLAAHGINSGINGGRACWTLAGTLCGGIVQGSYAAKLGNCMQCEFYLQVRREEADRFTPTRKILETLKLA